MSILVIHRIKYYKNNKILQSWDKSPISIVRIQLDSNFSTSDRKMNVKTIIESVFVFITHFFIIITNTILRVYSIILFLSYKRTSDGMDRDEKIDFFYITYIRHSFLLLLHYLRSMCCYYVMQNDDDMNIIGLGWSNAYVTRTSTTRCTFWLF